MLGEHNVCRASLAVVAEVKWRKLSAAEKRQVLSQLEQKWQRTALSQKHPKVRFEVFHATAIKG